MGKLFRELFCAQAYPFHVLPKIPFFFRISCAFYLLFLFCGDRRKNVLLYLIHVGFRTSFINFADLLVVLFLCAFIEL